MSTKTPYNQESINKKIADIHQLEQQPLEGAEQPKALAKVYVDLSDEYEKIGTPTTLAQAISASEQAIHYAEQLPVAVDEYRDVLASAYIGLGDAQISLGTPTDLQQALASYNEAIQLRKTLPLDNHAYRNNLATAYRRYGNAQWKLGTPSDLQQAIDSYNQAIKLSQELPLDNPEYRNDLAGVYMNRGSAQSKLGTPSDLQQAIESYNQAIKLRQELPLDNPEYRNNLAIAYYNRGNAQWKLSTPSDLQQAIASYNQAIKLHQELPLDNPEYCHSLAGIYCNLGNVQKVLNKLKQAIKSYNQGLAINESLDKQVWQYVGFRVNTLIGKTSACMRHGDFEEANNAAEEGLELLRDLEISGVYVLRSLRERLFGDTITTYLAMGPNFLIEFMLEHLEPNNEGAAPQSEAMHNVALHALQQLRLMATQGHPEWLMDIQQTISQLALIRARYFIGTVTGAQLMAQYHEENEKDIKRAEQILVDYTKQCPTDVEGYINLADFYRRRQQIPTASHIYETAINTVANHLPKQIDNETLASVIAMIIKLIDLAADLQFAPAFAQPADSDSARQQMLKHFNSAMAWLNKWALPEKLREAVELKITQTLVPQFEQKQNEWFKQQDTAQLQQWQKQEQAQQTQKQQWLSQAIQVLPKTEQQLMEAFLKMQEDLAQLERTANTAEIGDILAQRIQILIHQLHDSELATAMEKLAQTLSEVWQVLDEQDRKLLATALHCLNDDNLLRFAGMSLGLAVEKNLLERCFYPLREQLQQTNQAQQDKNISDFVEKKRELTLGRMVEIIKHITVPQKPQQEESQDHLLEIAFSQYLSQQPWGIRLLESIDKKRIKGLHKITGIRNRCAHPDPEQTPNRDSIEKMLESVVTGEEAFFRYFVGAFV
jgi:tetratricopeptide (TPR) repeat protein